MLQILFFFIIKSGPFTAGHGKYTSQFKKIYEINIAKTV